jgi:hypothetical protein
VNHGPHVILPLAPRFADNANWLCNVSYSPYLPYYFVISVLPP